jgi:hypothetical protein
MTMMDPRRQVHISQTMKMFMQAGTKPALWNYVEARSAGEISKAFPSQEMLFRIAQAAAADRDFTSSLCRMFATWRLAVPLLMNN